MNVSVLMPVYNAGPDLRVAIESILRQTHREFELLIIDDKSHDGSQSVIAEYAALDSRIKPVYHDKNMGLAATLNEGLGKACGELIARMDQDDESLPDRLAIQFDFMTNHPEIALAGSYVYHMGATPDDDVYIDLPTTPDAIRTRLQETNCIYHPSVIMRKKEVLEAGGYREAFRNTEDYDLWLRMSKEHDLANIPKPLLRFRFSVNGMTLGRKWEQIFYMKLALNSYKYPDVPLSDLSKAVTVEMSKIDRAELMNSAYTGAIGNLIQLKLWDNARFLAKKAYKDIGVMRSIRMMANIRQSIKMDQRDKSDIKKRIKGLENRKPKGNKGHILFTMPFMVIGGADTVILKIAEGFKKQGWGCSFITTLKMDKYIYGDNTPRYEAISKEVYSLNNMFDSADDWRDFVLYLIESRDADIVFNIGSEYIYNILPEIKRKYPHVRIIDQQFNEYGHMANNRRNSRYIDMTIVSNNKIQEIMEKEYYESAEKIKTILHGVDTQVEFNPSLVKSINPMPPQLSEGKFRVSYFGRFSEEKAPNTFVQIANHLREMDNMDFLMIGNGPEFEFVKNMVDRLGLSEKIYLPGFVDDPRMFMKVTDVVVIPSLIEGIPIVLLEALSMGVPVIASAVGGIPAVIEHGVTGFLCDSGKTLEFVDAIKKLYDDRNLKSRIASNGREYAVKKIDIQQMASEYHEVIRHVLKGS